MSQHLDGRKIEDNPIAVYSAQRTPRDFSTDGGECVITRRPSGTICALHRNTKDTFKNVALFDPPESTTVASVRS